MDLVKNIGRIDHHHIFSGALGSTWRLSVRSTKAKAWLDGLLTLPLVLPPTVAGFFLLYLFGAKRPAGIFLEKVFIIKSCSAGRQPFWRLS